MGPERVEDAEAYGRKKGQRIKWSVSLMLLRALLVLPICFNAEAIATEDDMDARAYGGEVSRLQHSAVTPGRVIHGLLSELSVHGGPDTQAEFSDGLKAQMAEVRAGTAELVSGDGVVSDLVWPGCAMMFDSLGGQSPNEVRVAVCNVGADENVAAALAKAFGGAVVVKERFPGHHGHEFQKTFPTINFAVPPHQMPAPYLTSIGFP